MTKHFRISEKKLKARYNRRIFVLNIVPLSLILMLAVMANISYHSFQPLIYYRFIILFTLLCVGYSFAATLIGSLIVTVRLKGNRQHSYVEIEGETLIVSKYIQSVFRNGKFIRYKRLWIINLAEVEDIYYYKGSVIVTAPARRIEERADWLSYTSVRGGIAFDRWWYDSNGGTLRGGVEIPDIFLSGQRVSRTIENAAGTMRKRSESRRDFRSKMLSISEKHTKN